MTVKDIEDSLKSVPVSDLPEAILQFENDERASVKKILKKYRKKHSDYKAELARLEGMLAFEKKYAACPYICGIDEAGRGPYAGPVVAAAVVLKKDSRILYLNDSKQLSAGKREELYGIIMQEAMSVGVGMASPEEIDEINILQADYLAMRRALGNLSVKPDVLLNDAVTIPGVDILQENIVHGDARSLSIAAASVIAKVTRDRMMVEYDREYPQYGFASHKGYGSRQHEEAIRKYGLCPIHRRSFMTKFF